MVVSSSLVMLEQLQRLSRDAGGSNVGLQILLVDWQQMVYGELSAHLFSVPSSAPADLRTESRWPIGQRGP